MPPRKKLPLIEKVTTRDKTELTRVIVNALAMCKAQRETKAADHLLEALRSLHPDPKERKK